MPTAINRVLIHVHLLLVEPTPIVMDALQDAWKNDFQPQDISGVNFFDMRTLRTATDNFSASNKLGQGGFGPVYKVCDLVCYIFASFFHFCISL